MLVGYKLIVTINFLTIINKPYIKDRTCIKEEHQFIKIINNQYMDNKCNMEYL